MLRVLSERLVGFSRERPLPKWAKPWRLATTSAAASDTAEVLLFADTFNRYFEPENLEAATTVLERAGFALAEARPALPGKRPLCCGRTFLTAGLTAQAEIEMRRTIDALKPALERGAYVVGLEPSCVLTFRDEAPALLRKAWDPNWSSRILLLEEYIDQKLESGEFELPLAALPKTKALVHGHCHQKSFALMDSVARVLALIPDLACEPIESSCCGMAGAFGYQAETVEISRAMAELSLLPKVRAAAADTMIVADGTSCRQQIGFGSEKRAMHAARLLLEASDRALARAG
jgi:Fe-S oxidoreductase